MPRGIKTAETIRLLEPYPSEFLNCYPVSGMAKIPGAKDPALLNPTGDKLFAETRPVNITSGYRSYKERHPANADTLDERRGEPNQDIS